MFGTGNHSNKFNLIWTKSPQSK